MKLKNWTMSLLIGSLMIGCNDKSSSDRTENETDPIIVDTSQDSDSASETTVNDSATEDSDSDTTVTDSDTTATDSDTTVTDSDTIIDECPNDANKTAPGVCGCGVSDADSDNDGVADCQDACPADALKTAAGTCGCGIADNDSDLDGIADCIDECPTDADKFVVGVCGCGVADNDSDFDGTADCVDNCPMDALKITSGVCGCGVADNDADEDGTLDCNDACPGDASKIAIGMCGCGIADIDGDGDGTMDCLDECPSDATKTSVGVCGCGVADVDEDGDGTMDCNDECPTDASKITEGQCGCGAAETDADGDGTMDCNDACPADADKIAVGVCGCGIEDADADGDGTYDCDDACPGDPAKIAEGVCGCGIEDADADGDGTVDCIDPAECGNSVVEDGEICDDGNFTDGDGCSECVVDDPFYTCDSASPSVCELQATDLGTFGLGDIIADTEISSTLAAGDSDVYQITFTEAVLLTGTLTNNSGDGDVFIYDTTLNELYRAENPGSEEPVSSPLAPGTYYFVVTAYESSGDISGYTFSLQTEANNCGNGVVDAGEACDDGNYTNNDGCSTCNVDAPFYTCDSASPSVCTEILTANLGVYSADDAIATQTGGPIAEGALDLYVIDFTTAVTLSGDFTNVGGLPLFIIYTEDLSQQLFGTGNPDFDQIVLEAGTYKLVMYAQPDGGDIESYTLSLATTANICGDGILDNTTEACDDGNDVDGDGCSACVVDVPFYTCDTASPSVCTEILTANLGAYSAGDAIATQTGGPVAEETLDLYVIDFTTAVTLSGNFTNVGGLPFFIIYTEDLSQQLFGTDSPSFDSIDLEAGTYKLVIYSAPGGRDIESYTLSLATTDRACGNGVLDIDAGETCDDGNNTDNDGCTQCQVDLFYTCDSSSPSICTYTCGDGVLDVDAGETCDDGNNTDNDGCTQCQVDLFYTCDSSSPSICEIVSTALGTYASGDAIADQVGGVLPAGLSDVYEITFTEPVVLTGTLLNESGDGDFYIYTSDLNTELYRTEVIGDEDISTNLAAGTYNFIVYAWHESDDIAGYTLSLATTANTCGDGILDNTTEACDDGNDVDGDGCSACVIDAPFFTCDGASPSVCTEIITADLGAYGAGDAIVPQTGGPVVEDTLDSYIIEFTTSVTLSGFFTNVGGLPVFAIYNKNTNEQIYGSDEPDIVPTVLAAGTYKLVMYSMPGAGEIESYVLNLNI